MLQEKQINNKQEKEMEQSGRRKIMAASEFSKQLPYGRRANY